MGKAQDLTGMKFGRLTAIKRVADHIEPSGRKVAMWECICDCGNTYTVSGKRLKNGITKSCGCLQKDRPNGTTHGMSNTEIWKHWKYMKMRCNCKCKNSLSYKNYYKRGITYCEEWEDFEPFYEWAMSHGYKDGLTLDRINNDKGYSPDNCRWTTIKEQQNNTRRNRLITYNGRTQTLTQWAEEKGIKYQTLDYRLKNWNIEKAMEIEVNKWGE